MAPPLLPDTDETHPHGLDRFGREQAGRRRHLRLGRQTALLALHNHASQRHTEAGGAPLRLILDSGMAYDGILVFDKDKVDTAAFRGLRESAVAGAGSGGGSAALVDEGACFTVGGLHFRNQRIAILTGGTFKGFPTDGVIGYSLPGHYAVEIDYDRSMIILYESETFSAGPGWESLPLYFKDKRIPWIDIAIATDDEAPVRISTYIDSASGGALELLSRTANKFRLPLQTKETFLGRGLSRDIHGQQGIIGRMRIRSHRSTNNCRPKAPTCRTTETCTWPGWALGAITNVDFVRALKAYAMMPKSPKRTGPWTALSPDSGSRAGCIVWAGYP